MNRWHCANQVYKSLLVGRRGVSFFKPFGGTLRARVRPVFAGKYLVAAKAVTDYQKDQKDRKMFAHDVEGKECQVPSG